jgi:hypothetical protein
MNAFCPIMSFQSMHSGGVYCLGKNCGFADAAGECLIKQALQCYVSRERTAAAERESADQCWLIKKDGTRTPIVFNEESNSFHPDDYWKGLQGGL